MDNTNYYPAMLLDVVVGDALAGDPFMLVDVGCGLGIESAWRLFGRHLAAHAIDPQIEEIERLRQAEENPQVHYHTAFVGVPGEPRPEPEGFFNSYFRTSTRKALVRATADGPAPLEEMNDWEQRDLTTRKVPLADFLRSHHVDQVDFVKTDTDGVDFEVLRSFEDMIEPARVLGFMVETPFTGTLEETAHSFPNVDRLLKRHGFLLCTLSVNRYSRAALPAPFSFEMLAQTTFGQPMWGDLVYLREAVHPDHVRFGELSPRKLLKLACLYELFQAPDISAEILLAHRERLAPLVDVDHLLDLLTPTLAGEQLGYQEYVAAFDADPTRFYPSNLREPDPEPEPPPPPPPPPPTLVQQAKHLAARALGRVKS